MELHDWALCSRLITQADYRAIVKAQFAGTLSGLRFDGEGFLVRPPNDFVDLPLIRKHPVGDVIDHMNLAEQLYARAQVSDLQELVSKWQQWHVDHFEPICNYSTVTRFGQKLYTSKAEKKLVAWFANNARVRDGGTIIMDADTVVIPEGSSAFYIGLAIAASRKRVSVITSNGALHCEYMANPVLASSFDGFHLIGGLADLDANTHQSEHAGVFGLESQEAYRLAIQESPRATVVIVPVSGLLPHEGPFATEGAVSSLKHSIIEDSVGEGLAEKVRELVFVGDYTKHLGNQVGKYGAPVLDRGHWRDVVEGNRERICLVTAPPPALRDALASEVSPVHPGARQTLAGLAPRQPLGKYDRQYNETAYQFAQQFYDEQTRLTFHEAITLDDKMAVKLSNMTLSGVGLVDPSR